MEGSFFFFFFPSFFDSLAIAIRALDREQKRVATPAKRDRRSEWTTMPPAPETLSNTTTFGRGARVNWEGGWCDRIRRVRGGGRNLIKVRGATDDWPTWPRGRTGEGARRGERS